MHTQGYSYLAQGAQQGLQLGGHMRIARSQRQHERQPWPIWPARATKNQNKTLSTAYMPVPVATGTAAATRLEARATRGPNARNKGSALAVLEDEEQ